METKVKVEEEEAVPLYWAGKYLIAWIKGPKVVKSEDSLLYKKDRAIKIK